MWALEGNLRKVEIKNIKSIHHLESISYELPRQISLLNGETIELRIYSLATSLTSAGITSTLN